MVCVSERQTESTEWKMEQGKGRGNVVCFHVRFRPPVSQMHHVTHADKKQDPELRERLREGGD